MYVYTRKGIIPGVPTRDLTEDEYKQHQKRIRAAEKATKRILYIRPVNPSLPSDDGGKA